MENNLLEVARRKVTAGECIVSNMERILSELQREGHDGAEAEEMLRTSRELLVEMREEVANRERASTGGSIGLSMRE